MGNDGRWVIEYNEGCSALDVHTHIGNIVSSGDKWIYNSTECVGGSRGRNGQLPSVGQDADGKVKSEICIRWNEIT